jgi:hypothetical protein
VTPIYFLALLNLIFTKRDGRNLCPRWKESISKNTFGAGTRRLIIPKSDLSFRSACQLDPIDSLLFAAIIREIGRKIETRRVTPGHNSVFSHRFEAATDGRLYAEDTGWEQFWKQSSAHCDRFSHVVITDIADFYNQIYHHVIENQLAECQVADGYWHAIKNLLSNVSDGVSRGVPIGPHPAHLLAELTLIPVDNFLKASGYTFCRYVDDIHIFCQTRDEAHKIVYQLVEYLDKTQKMQINKQKTGFFSGEAHRANCAENVVDKPINAFELEFLRSCERCEATSRARIRVSNMPMLRNQTLRNLAARTSRLCCGTTSQRTRSIMCDFVGS